MKPMFDNNHDLSEESLKVIETWRPNFDAARPWNDLFAFIKSAWNLDFGKIFETSADNGETLIVFVTGGWSSNEEIIDAMQENALLRIMRWYSSERGGLHKYILLDARETNTKDWF